MASASATESTHRCAKCGSRVDFHTAYVIGYSKASAMEWVYLCGACEVALRRWLAA